MARKTLPYGPLGFPNVRAWGMAPPLAPSDLDPVEAASSPITPDPPLRRRVGTDAFAAVLEDSGGDVATAVRAYAAELSASGIEPQRAMREAAARAAQHQSLSGDPGIFYEAMEPQAAPGDYNAFSAGMAEAETGMNREQRLAASDQWAAGVDRRKAAYDRATGLQEPAAAGGSTANMRPGESEAGPGYKRVPAPRIPFGGPVPEPGMINDPEAIEDYTTREWDGRRNEYKPSPKDRAMAARGMVPVLNPDGSVGYSVGYPPGSITGENPNRFPGAAGRSGERRDLTDAGWTTETVASPLGQQNVYRPGERQAAQIENVDKRRLARRAGITSDKAQGMSIEELRLAAQGAADDDAIARRNAWKSQTMLAGGQPTGGPMGTKAATNAFDRLTPEQQQEVIKNRMLYGERNGQRGDEWDRRLDLMRIESEARFKEAEAARAEARDEREKDRTLTREERQAAREADERRFAEERAARDLELKERSRQFDLQQLEGQRRGEQQGTALAAQLAQIQSQAEASRSEMEMKRATQSQALAAQDRAMEMKFMAERPGEYAVATGLQTPEADDFLKRLASQSDRFQWLPGGGFGEREAGSLNASLLDLARQAEIAGINTRLRDRAYREELIKKYGYASGWSGGRGGWMGDFWQPIPPDPTVAAQ